MNVERILEAKGTEVFTISADATIKEAVNVLGEKNIGAVIVHNANTKIAGILSERDVVRRLCSQGPQVLDQRVDACMTPTPFTCPPEASVDDVMSEMTSRRIRHMPVMKGDELVGLVSIGDVVKRKIELAVQEAEDLKSYIAL